MGLKSKQSGNSAQEELLKRFVEFLKESNAYAKILNIDYSLPELQKKEFGYFGAFLQSQEMAIKHEPISLSDLSRWQAMIVLEQLQFGHTSTKQAMGKIRSPDMPINIKIEGYEPPDFSKVPALFEKLINTLNKKLEEVGNKGDEVFVAALLGDIVQKFEKIHPFVEANGRVGQLIANYIASWFEYPIIVFRLSEKAEFYAAHDSPRSMRQFMAKKLQESIFDEEGRVLTLFENYGLSASYYNPDNPEAEKLLVEWHSLVEAMNQWKEEQ